MPWNFCIEFSAKPDGTEDEIRITARNDNAANNRVFAKL